MIQFTLRCGKGHRFDSWFGSAAAYGRLAEDGRLRCPTCGDGDVAKAPMAPRVRPGRGDAPEALPKAGVPASPDLASAMPPKLRAAIETMRRRIEATTEDVGRAFARQARAMHLGDIPDRPIRGEASADEVRGLIEDDVPVSPVPSLPRLRDN
jgi:hypothetical protein